VAQAFLGSFVVESLRERGCRNVIVPRSKEYDLRGPRRDRATVQGNEASHRYPSRRRGWRNWCESSNPGRFFYDNAIMGMQLMEYARQFGVEKIYCCRHGVRLSKVHISSVQEKMISGTVTRGNKCALWSSEENAPRASASIPTTIWVHSIYLLPVNLYGPRDNFDLETSHVIPGIIRKCVDAKEGGCHKIELWGDGSATREFLYVEDAAAGILLATERYNGEEPVNLGSGEEIAIRDLAKMIAGQVGFDGDTRWNTSKPNGQPRRCLDTSRAAAIFRVPSDAPFARRDPENSRVVPRHRRRFEKLLSEVFINTSLRTMFR